MNYDVIIIGGGPTGLMLGCLLKLSGIHCCIFEKNEFNNNDSRAVLVHSASIEIFDILGVYDRLRKFSTIGTHLAFYYRGSKSVEFDFTQENTLFPYYLLIKQSDVEKILLDKYIELGGEYIQNATLIDIKEYESKDVSCYIREFDNIKEYNSKFLMGCDGAGSTVRKLANIDFLGNTNQFSYLVGEGYTFSNNYPKSEISIHLTDNAAISFLPLPDNTIRVAGPINSEILDNYKENKNNTQDLQGLLDNTLNKIESLFNVNIREYTRLETYRVHEKIAKVFNIRNIFLLGDAAHLNLPAGGQAMNSGFQDAFNLAWKIAFTLKNRANSSLLETYKNERMLISYEVQQNANFSSLLSLIKSTNTNDKNDLIHEIGKKTIRKISQLYIDYKNKTLDGKIENFQILTKLSSKLNVKIDYTKYNFICSSLKYLNIIKTAYPYSKVFTLAKENFPFREDECLLLRPDGYIQNTYKINDIIGNNVLVC